MSEHQGEAAEFAASPLGLELQARLAKRVGAVSGESAEASVRAVCDEWIAFCTAHWDADDAAATSYPLLECSWHQLVEAFGGLAANLDGATAGAVEVEAARRRRAEKHLAKLTADRALLMQEVGQQQLQQQQQKGEEEEEDNNDDDDDDDDDEEEAPAVDRAMGR